MKRLLYLRESKYLTQKEVASFLDIPTSTYSSYEIGSRQPNLIILRELATFFNVSADYLLDLDLASNFKLPEKIANIGEAVSFLKQVNLLSYITGNEDEKIIIFSQTLYNIIANFKWN